MKAGCAAALLGLALLAGGGSAVAQQSSPSKKAVIQRILALQQGEIEAFARSLVERPAAQMMQEAGLALQQQLPPEKRQAAGKAIEAEVRKYIDEAYPIARERALKLAPSTVGAVLEAKMTEDELKALLAWLESPTNRKYQQVAVEVRKTFAEKLIGELPPVLDPKLQALDGRIRVILGVPPANASAATPPARPASK
jgi:hypothetical protein